MQLGMIGLGRMGGNMARRLMKAGHTLVVYDHSSEAIRSLADHGAIGTSSLADLIDQLTQPRALWLMVPAAVVDSILKELLPLLAAEDIVIDGGNSYYHDDIRRATTLSAHGIHYLDVGTSGGIWGLERGYCLMIGGEKQTVQRLDSIFAALAPGEQAAAPTPGRAISGTATQGYLHCGPSGAGHFVKMIHNGIEYGLMAAYAEGFNILNNANIGLHSRASDAETAPLRNPEHYRYQLEVAEIAEVWRRGSVIGSWLLDLTAATLGGDPQLDGFSGRVSDSGEGRWTVAAAVEEGVPVPVLSAALYQRFSSRDNDSFADKLVSAMRYQFGGHIEKAESNE